MATKLSNSEIANRKAGGAEYSKSAKNEAGWYVLDRGIEVTEIEVNGKPMERYVRILCREHPKFGTVGADALVATGYVFEREATAEELTEIDARSEAIFMPKEESKGSSGVSREEFKAMQDQLAKLGDMVPRAELEAMQKQLDDMKASTEAKADEKAPKGKE